MLRMSSKGATVGVRFTGSPLSGNLSCQRCATASIFHWDWQWGHWEAGGDGAVNSTHPKSGQPWREGTVVEMSSERRGDARKCRGGEGRFEGKEVRGELGKQETEKEGIWKVGRRRVGEAFSLVNNGLRHISHMIFSLCLLPLSTFPPHSLFLRSISASQSPPLATFLLSCCSAELPRGNSGQGLDINMCLCACVQLSHTHMCLWACLWLHGCAFFAGYSTHPAVKPYENNTAYHFAPLPPTQISS